MTYYNVPQSRYWLYEAIDGTLYKFGVYMEEYPDGSAHTVVGSFQELTGVPARRKRESAEKVPQEDVPEVVQEAAERREG